MKLSTPSVAKQATLSTSWWDRLTRIAAASKQQGFVISRSQLIREALEGAHERLQVLEKKLGLEPTQKEDLN